ncbi:MAG: alcohol dehydrogenase catalytic domain-containing protein, partial [Pseudomonadota bacterium]
MRAMVLRTPADVSHSPLIAEQRPTPEPGRGEVRLRVLCCGVCHTDLHLVEGELRAPRLPLVPGHQIVGEVEACGPGVDSSWLGRRVGVPWLAWTCGGCDACLGGTENLCPSARFTGFDADGGFAQQALAAVDFLVELPDEMGDPVSAAPLLCGGV